MANSKMSSKDKEEKAAKDKEKWEKDVKDKDGNKCKKCKTNKKLVVHCKVPDYSDERKKFDIENGVTLCTDCLAKTLDVIGVRRQRNKIVLMYG